MTGSAFTDAMADLCADPNLGTVLLWEASPGGPQVEVRGVFSEQAPPPPLTDPRNQPHSGPVLRVTVGAFEFADDGRFLLGDRVFTVLQWDLSRTGASFICYLEERTR